MAPFQALEVSIQLVAALREPVSALSMRDPGLADQIRRAASSVSLNLGEGARRVGKDRIQLWRVASGSAAEVRTSLRLAQAWGHLDEPALAPSLELCERVLAMLWRLTH